MTKRNCKVGDLAVTVTCELVVNLGKIVRIEAPAGWRQWQPWGRVFVWKVSVLSGAGSGLVYEYPDGWVEECFVGGVPDCLLRPITPPRRKQARRQSRRKTRPSSRTHPVAAIAAQPEAV